MSHLHPQHVDEVFEKWEFSDIDDGILGVKLMIEYFPTAAIYRKTDLNEHPKDENVSDKSKDLDLKLKESTGYEINDLWSNYSSDVLPIAWCLKKLTGEAGITCTAPEYRRKGLASACTVAVCEEMIKCGDQPYVEIHGENPASTTMHCKLGFVKSCQTVKFVYKKQ